MKGARAFGLRGRGAAPPRPAKGRGPFDPVPKPVLSRYYLSKAGLPAISPFRSGTIFHRLKVRSVQPCGL